jgi:hypothetical protein
VDLRHKLILNDMNTMVSAYKLAHARLAAAGRRPKEAKNREALAKAIVKASNSGLRTEAELVRAALAASIALRKDQEDRPPAEPDFQPASQPRAVWQKLKRRLPWH